MLLLAFLLPLLATFAEAEKWPACAGSCISQAVAATGCSSSDSHCICSSDVFTTTNQDCVSKGCEDADIESAIASAGNFCDSVTAHLEVRDPSRRKHQKKPAHKAAPYGKKSVPKKKKKASHHKEKKPKAPVYKSHKGKESEKGKKNTHSKGPEKKTPWWKKPWSSGKHKDNKKPTHKSPEKHGKHEKSPKGYGGHKGEAKHESHKKPEHKGHKSKPSYGHTKPHKPTHGGSKGEHKPHNPPKHHDHPKGPEYDHPKGSKPPHHKLPHHKPPHHKPPHYKPPQDKPQPKPTYTQVPPSYTKPLTYVPGPSATVF